MTLDSFFDIKRLSTLIHIGMFLTTITVFALLGAFALQSSNENVFAQSSSQSSSPVTNNNATIL